MGEVLSAARIASSGCCLTGDIERLNRYRTGVHGGLVAALPDLCGLTWR